MSFKIVFFLIFESYELGNCKEKCGSMCSLKFYGLLLKKPFCEKKKDFFQISDHFE